jgi:hypothetical protein
LTAPGKRRAVGPWRATPYRRGLRLRPEFVLSAQGPLRGGTLIDPDSYRHFVAAFTRGAFDAKRAIGCRALAAVVPARR